MLHVLLSPTLVGVGGGGGELVGNSGAQVLRYYFSGIPKEST